jgi:hypothetical protein
MVRHPKDKDCFLKKRHHKEPNFLQIGMGTMERRAYGIPDLFLCQKGL